MGITVRGLAALKPGKWLSDTGNRNEGALRAKGGPSGARFYFRYRDSQGRYDDYPLGSHDANGRDGMSLIDARARAGELSDRYRRGERDLRQILDAEMRQAELDRAAADAAREAAEAQQAATLGALLNAYVADMERAKKPSARAVGRSLHLHVEQAWPVLWGRPASAITDDDLLAVVAKLANAGKMREAAKVRAYLRAAYTAAVRARRDATALPALRELKITHNPALEMVPIAKGTGARERALSIAELRAYWAHVCQLPEPDGSLLRFHLLTGAQRLEQLGRLTVADFDREGPAVRLRDSKGRRQQPRLHVVPLIPEAVTALEAMQGGTLGAFLFTVTAGRTGAVYATVQHRVRAVAERMQEAGELERGVFTPGDLRRTVETRLAAEGVSLEVRAQLQSHGLGGVQAKHYDRHDYMEEKRQALRALHGVLTGAGTGAKVVPIKRKAGG